MTVTEDAASNDSARTGTIRTIIGLAQGIVLYLLFDASQSKAWPATDGPTFAALYTTAIFVPLIAVTALGHLRVALLVGWALFATLLCAGLAYYDIIRDPVALAVPRHYPSAQFWLSLSFGLFIGHNLLISGASDGRFFARYPTYFETSWKYGLQIFMAALFAVVFWLLLKLGAELFKLIKIDLPSQIIQKNWFWIPATTVVLNYALHMTDVRVAIIRGVRVLSCNLLSWLLPLMTLIAVAFVAALPFTGLEPLWNTRRASTILLVAAASLIFLVNSAYQDGTRIGGSDASGEKPMSLLLRFSMIAASIALTVLVALAAYGIYLRVGQYGWTPARIIATACAAIAACYASGYFIAAVHRHTRFSRLEATNVVTAFVVVGILLALFTPLADPARIAVADQIRRLNAGITTPDNFDYTFLRFSSGRYGLDALNKLAEQTTWPTASQRSAEILKAKNQYEARRPQIPITPELRTANITVAQPPGQTLPKSFLDIDWNRNQRSFLLPHCLTTNAKCDAVLVDLDGDGSNEIILIPSPAGISVVLKFTSGSWSYAGNLSNSGCPDSRNALLSGKFEVAQPAFRDVLVAGHRLSMNFAGDCTVNSAITIKAN